MVGAKIVSEIFKMPAPTSLSLRTHKTRLTTQEAQELERAQRERERRCVSLFYVIDTGSIGSRAQPGG